VAKNALRESLPSNSIWLKTSYLPFGKILKRFNQTFWVKTKTVKIRKFKVPKLLFQQFPLYPH